MSGHDRPGCTNDDRPRLPDDDPDEAPMSRFELVSVLHLHIVMSAVELMNPKI